MRANLYLFWSGIRVSWASYLVELTPTVYFGVRVPRILLQALFFVFIAKAAGGDQLARFALIGNAVQIGVFFALLSMETIIEEEKWNNTFQYLIASPASWVPIMLGKGAAFLCDAIINIIIIFAFLVPILNLPIGVENLLISAPVILITILSAGTLGWFIGAISLSTRWGYSIGNMGGYLMMILCGVNFPFFALPPYIQAIGHLLPVTHGLLAIRAIIDGATYLNVLPLIITEVIIAILYGSIAWLTFGYRLYIARKNGTFELV